MKYIIIGLISLVVLSITLLVWDFCSGESITKEGIIIEKKYQEPHDKVGTGVVTTSEGQSAVVVTQEHESEAYYVVAQCPDGYYKCRTDINTYYAKQCGQTVTVSIYKGGLYGITYAITAR